MTDNDHLDLLVYVGPLRGDTPTPTRAKLVGTLRLSNSRQSAFFQYSSDWIWGIEHEPHNFFAIDPRLKLLRGAWQPLEFSGFLFDAHPSPIEYRRIANHRAFSAFWIACQQGQADVQKSKEPSISTFVADVRGMPDAVRLGAFSFTDPSTGNSIADPTGWVPTWRQLRTARSNTRRALSGLPPSGQVEGQLPIRASLPGYDFHVKVAGEDALRRPITCVFPFDENGRETDDTSWIATQLAMAHRAGIEVAFSGVVDGKSKPPTLIFSRFDRDGACRVPFISAATFLGMRPSEPTSFLAIAMMIQVRPNHSKHDLEQLWRRAVFGCLADILSTTLTIGFLWRSGQWRLAPMWFAEQPGGMEAMAPDRDWRWRDRLDEPPFGNFCPPLSIGPKTDLPRLEDALSVAETFGLELPTARKIAGEIGVQVNVWRDQAKVYGVSPRYYDLFKSIFDTPDLRLARSFADPRARIKSRGMGRG